LAGFVLRAAADGFFAAGVFRTAAFFGAGFLAGFFLADLVMDRAIKMSKPALRSLLSGRGEA
jgi:hypothetical protein